MPITSDLAGRRYPDPIDRKVHDTRSRHGEQTAGLLGCSRQSSSYSGTERDKLIKPVDWLFGRPGDTPK